jgi:hypothetical protein
VPKGTISADGKDLTLPSGTRSGYSGAGVFHRSTDEGGACVGAALAGFAVTATVLATVSTIVAIINNAMIFRFISNLHFSILISIRPLAKKLALIFAIFGYNNAAITFAIRVG